MMRFESELKSDSSGISQHNCSPNLPSEKDTSSLDENQVFERWKLSTGQEKEELQLLLVKLLTKHAHAVCWGRIPDLQNDHGWICNEAVYRALRHSGNFKGKSKFSTWFHRIVFNICNNALKAKQRKGEEVELSDAVENGFGGGDPVVAKIWLDQVEKMGSKEDRRSLGMLARGYTKGEIAKELGISLGLVQTRWWRLRGRLNAGE